MKTEPAILFSPFRLDPGNARLWHGSQVIRLRPKSFAVLQYLLERPGQLVTKEELLNVVWPNTYVSDALVKDSILEIRKALGDDPRAPQFVETVHRRGYRFIAPVATSAALVPSSKFQVPHSDPQDSALRTQHSVLVGRGSELARLRAYWEKARQGERQLVFVTGEPGIGKTTIVEAFLKSLESRVQSLASESRTGFSSTAQTLDPRRRTLDARPWVGRGQCVEHYGAGEAYMPVLEALGRLCREPEGEQLIDVLSRYAPTWLAQLPALLTTEDFERLQRKVQGATHERMLREMAEALETLTAEQPLILCLEDLHWSDVSTLELLSVLARRHERARLLVLGTYRPVEMLGNGHPLRAVKQELQLHQQCEELRLGFLTEQYVAEYLMSRFAAGAHDRTSRHQLARTIHQRTEGNPLFMINVVDYMTVQGVLGAAGETRLAAPIDVPANIRQLIEKQLDRLSPEEQRVLEVASVAGADFSAAAAASGTKMTTSEVEAYGTGLVRREQFLRTDGISEWPDGTVATRYHFLHALYQEVLYERIPAGQRISLHKWIGEREEQAYGDKARAIAAELAVHFERGRDYWKAIRYLQQAGENALQRSAHQEAISQLTKGLELLKLLPDTPERIQRELLLLTILGPALIAAQGYAAPGVAQIYARAQELCRQVGDTPQLFPVLWGLGHFYLNRAEHKTTRKLGEQLLTLAQSVQDPALIVEAHFVLGSTAFFLGEFASAREHLEQGLVLYDSQPHGSHAVLYGQDPGVLCLSYAAFALWNLGYAERAFKRSRERLALAQELAHPHSLVIALALTAVFHQFRGEKQAAQEQAEAAIALCNEHGFPYWLAEGTMLRGWALAEQGQGTEGIAQLRQGLAVYQATGAELGQSYWLALLAEAYGKVGQPEEGLRVLAEALAQMHQSGEHWHEVELYRLKGELLLQQQAHQKPVLSVVEGANDKSQQSLIPRRKKKERGRPPRSPS